MDNPDIDMNKQETARYGLLFSTTLDCHYLPNLARWGRRQNESVSAGWYWLLDPTLGEIWGQDFSRSQANVPHPDWNMEKAIRFLRKEDADLLEGVGGWQGEEDTRLCMGVLRGLELCWKRWLGEKVIKGSVSSEPLVWGCLVEAKKGRPDGAEVWPSPYWRGDVRAEHTVRT